MEARLTMVVKGNPAVRQPGRVSEAYLRSRARCIAEETECWLCRKPVNKRLSGRHPLGPTADHVIPISRGGPQCDRTNMRLAHNRCNAARGNRMSVAKQEHSEDW